jgi:hypothetical protein
MWMRLDGGAGLLALGLCILAVRLADEVGILSFDSFLDLTRLP